MNNASCNVTFTQGSVPLATVYSLVLIFGLPANLLSLTLSALKIRRKNVLSVYLFTLSLSDLIYLATIPWWISYARNSSRWIHSSLACSITGYIFFNNLYISILLLCCISVDRCLVVLYPIEAQWRRRRRVAVAVCLTVWVTVMLVHTPVFYLSTVQTSKEKNDSCFETIPMPDLVANFNYARFCIGFCLPLTILVTTNCLIFRRIQSSPCLNTTQKRKIKYLALSVILIFLVCFAPYHIILLSRALAFSLSKDSCWFEEQIYGVSITFLCLCTVNSIVNPFLYMFSSESVRQELRRDLRLLFFLPLPRESGTETYFLNHGTGSKMSSSLRKEVTSNNK
ncbi:probable G-protein coupled receptor 132 [Leucoraja erinacea]|uniref:probable G-protein coupled receptor 132 n=1 Tax=Leucoraja erinaceus TaxID=7782 RepID=UPI0024566E87|nr:probable G-protein coupled receptor 132 [Leucoraja erinacea]